MEGRGALGMSVSADAALPAAAPERLGVVLINPYELGRQPFALAQAAAWLRRDGFDVDCIDLSLQRLDPATLAQARLVALYVGMHTATRIAIEALPRIRELAPRAHLCAFGLYAPMNQRALRELGVQTVLGGECEPALLELASSLRLGKRCEQQRGASVPLAKIGFLVPERSGLPTLERYAHLNLPDGREKTTGFAETSRGCKHLCRHCPVVPVYQGKFRVVPVDIVMADIAQQVAAGAEHISFGDPDFFNGSTHAMKVLAAMHAEFPQLSFDATIKIEHLIAHRRLLPALKHAGCLFVTTAVESVDDAVLERLDKKHTRADFEYALKLCREAGIAVAPTFIPFTPWSTLAGYVELLRTLLRLRLAAAVPAVQLCIRLLIPEGSWLLRLPEICEQLEAFDSKMLGYPWRHADPRVDALQVRIQSLAAMGGKLAREEVFAQIWQEAHQALGMGAPVLNPADFGEPIACMSEPWYCCAEPTAQQLECI